MVEAEIISYAETIYEDFMNDNSDCLAMFDFTFYCANEKYNVYPMIYIYKLHAEVLEIVRKKIDEIRKTTKFEARRELRRIDRRILNLYDNEENINLVFKLLCESCGGEYPFADDVFTAICYFLNNLMEVRAQTVQNKLLILFEKRAYSHKFFRQIYTYLMTHAKKLNTTNFVELHGKNFGTTSRAGYLIDDNRELQMLRMIALMSSRLNYTMKNYMANQIYSDSSYDLVYASTTYMKAILPYMHYQRTYDNLLMCMSVVLEFVDGDYRSDTNIQKVLDYDFIMMAASILNLNYFMPPDKNVEKTRENIESVVKFNF